MINARKAIAILRQLRLGRTILCGWIADGSSLERKSAWGLLQSLRVSKTGLSLRIACHYGQTRIDAGYSRTINWQLSREVVRLILGSIDVPAVHDSGSIRSVSLEFVERVIDCVRAVVPVPSPSLTFVPVPR